MAALALLGGMALSSAPASGAPDSPVARFKADLLKTIGLKKGVIAACTAARTIAKHLRKDAGGDPDKIKAFTKLAIKVLKGRKADDGTDEDAQRLWDEVHEAYGIIEDM